jgi:hypothetical protein
LIYSLREIGARSASKRQEHWEIHRTEFTSADKTLLDPQPHSQECGPIQLFRRRAPTPTTNTPTIISITDAGSGTPVITNANSIDNPA